MFPTLWGLIVKEGKRSGRKRWEVGKDELSREQYPDLEGVAVWCGVSERRGGGFKETWEGISDSVSVYLVLTQSCTQM